MASDLDLSTIFKAVTQTLAENEQSLNEADVYNHDHGSNMVNTFKTVQKAVARKKNKTASEQLAYASQVLRKKSTSGSAQVYAQGLENAAQQFTGKEVTRSSIGTLINAMMGSAPSQQAADTGSSGDLLGSLLGNLSGTQQPTQAQPSGDLMGSLLSGLTGSGQSSQSSGSSDLLGSLLSGMTGSSAPANQSDSGTPDLLGSLLTGATAGSGTQQPAPESGNLLGSLLSGMAGGSEAQSQSGGGDMLTTLLGGLAGNQQSGGSDGMDISDLLSAGLAYFSAKQQGGSTMEAIMQALGASSPLGKREDRKQSGALVINTLLNLLGKK